MPDAPFCVGFAAESREPGRVCRSQAPRKKLPLLVGNLVQDALGGDDNAVTLFDDQGQHPLAAAPTSSTSPAALSPTLQMLDGN